MNILFFVQESGLLLSSTSEVMSGLYKSNSAHENGALKKHSYMPDTEMVIIQVRA